MAFFQAPPRLGNQFDEDPLAREFVQRVLPDDVRTKVDAEYRHLGDFAGGDLYEAMLADRTNEPTLVQWDPWGNRIDQIEITPLWRRAQRLSAEHGLVAAGYEGTHGRFDRVHQFLMNYLVQASLDIYSCPLAMTDGAARTLRDTNNEAVMARALPRLLSRDPATMWTSGQWMTERTGGSDVGKSETIAKAADGGFHLHGTKWFTSATTSEMALTLGRPEGNPEGGRGLALFYVETRDDHGALNGIQINRLKEKFGTKKVPTAELTLDGCFATPVIGTTDGIKNIASMLNITRTWNAVAAAWGTRRGLALARDYAKRRHAFGAYLEKKPLHLDTLADMAAEAEAAFHLAFATVTLIGQLEHGEGTDADRQLLRALTPITKLTTAKQGVAVASETLEAFGGAGYVEDTGLPRLLADAQVLPIWEGTTNVLSLDTLRALAKDNSLGVVLQAIDRRVSNANDAELKGAVDTAKRSMQHAQSWLEANLASRDGLEGGARRFAMTLGRTLELALMIEHADWCRANKHGRRAIAVANRFAQRGVDLIRDDVSLEDTALVAMG
ncbi:MAG: acyl-CoA dehydrogenase family protein [Deltaproteobacteria bacterium]